MNSKLDFIRNIADIRLQLEEKLRNAVANNFPQSQIETWESELVAWKKTEAATQAAALAADNVPVLCTICGNKPKSCSSCSQKPCVCCHKCHSVL